MTRTLHKTTENRTLPLAFIAPILNGTVPTIKFNVLGLGYSEAWENIKGDFDGHPLEMLCPVCGDCQIHFNDPEVKRGNDNNEASSKVRGDVIEVPMFCEHGDSFNLKIGFHKGSVKLWTEKTDAENDQEWRI